MNDDEIVIKIKAFAMEIRGHVIDKVTELEVLIDTYIAYQFTNDKKKSVDMMSSVLSYLSFYKKTEIFKDLVNDKNPELRVRHPTFFNDLDYIRKQRNILAHSKVNTSKEAIDNFKISGNIYLVGLRDTIKLNGYNSKKVDELLTKIYSQIKILEIII